MKNNKGFTLIEVIASLVIITIVLISFAQIFIQANKQASLNNEKLVVINLADAVLEKLKATPVQKKTITNVNEYFQNEPTTMILNGKTYTISYQASQNSTKHTNTNFSESELNFIRVVVTVISPNGKTKATTEGYVVIEQTT